MPRILLVADGRSVHARAWERQVNELGLFEDVRLLPSRGGNSAQAGGRLESLAKDVLRQRPGAYPSATSVRLQGLLAHRKGRRLSSYLDQYRPGIVHCMRIPFEAFVVRAAIEGMEGIKLATSIWGNDLELFANRYPSVREIARDILSSSDALHADAGRDIRTAGEYGWGGGPELLAPVNGGVDLDYWFPDRVAARQRLGISADAFVVVNPRGIRPYVDSEVLLDVAETFATQSTKGLFVGVGYRADPHLNRRAEVLPNVMTSNWLSQDDLKVWCQAADVVISPSRVDGTANSVLESACCGAFPVVTDLSPLRAMFEDRRNAVFVPIDAPTETWVDALRWVRSQASAESATERTRAWIAQEWAPPEVRRRMGTWYQALLDM